MQIPINKEIRHYQEEIFLGLNLRQMICSGAAIAVAVAVYLGLTRCWVMKRRLGLHCGRCADCSSRIFYL